MTHIAPGFVREDCDVADITPVRWKPDRAAKLPPWPVPSLAVALGRGFRRLCPACGKTHLFRGYLAVEPVCASCGAPVGRARADDAPPYFTILVVGHIVVPLMLLSEQHYAPPVWLTAAIFVPLTVVLSLALLPLIKGATVGLMLRLGMMKTADE
jgi:uncharacterized protein (DUF983 family)